MMLSAATSTISVRMMNITLRSTFSALKNVSLRCRQSVMMIGRPAASSILRRVASILSGSLRNHFDDADFAVLVEIGLRLSQRQIDEHAVKFRTFQS